MVRLKVWQFIYRGFMEFLFQFHYGTIKSIMAGKRYPNKQYFNSTMVRLKGGLFVLLPVRIAHFNSTMVRLKVPDSLCRYVSIVFQFHYGTIKSILASKSP